MSFKVQVGPPQIAIHQGQTVLVAEQDGQIGWPSEKGLYFLDTRMVSSWSLYANGEPWDLLNGGAITYHAARIFQTNRAFLTEDGPIQARTLGLTLSRHLGGGMHEDIDVSNNSQKPVRFNLEIALRSDFADIFEVKSNRIVRRGRISTHWSESRQQFRLTYRNKDFCREVIITANPTGAKAMYANGRLSFEISLDPDESWHCCLLYDLVDGKDRHTAPRECLGHSHKGRHLEAIEEWERTVLKIRTSNEEFYRCYHQGIQDMAALRLPIAGTDRMVFIPAAGLPWFVALFGRDSLIVSLQTMLVYPEFARGALDVLGAHQAQERDDYRDAEPGKILHELRYGELAHFKLIPHTPYYGTSDATPLYLIALHSAWRATGDRSLIERHLRTAEGCLDWIDNYGDRDGDGFQEYQTRSSAGYENTGWKDSGDSVMYTDGTLVKGPKALCELQGYVYDAWVRMAQIYDTLGRHDRARHLREKAIALYRKFNEAFWDEESGFYAYTLDGDKKPVFSVASNPGHCLWSGIVPQGTRGARGQATDAAGYVEWLGYPHAVGQPPGVQSLQLSDRRGLAARQRHHRHRLPPLWLRGRSGGGGTQHQRRRQPFPDEPAAGTLCRPATRPEQFSRAICRRERAAGLGGRRAVRAAAGHARHLAGRTERQTLRRSCAAGLAA